MQKMRCLINYKYFVDAQIILENVDFAVLICNLEGLRTLPVSCC